MSRAIAFRDANTRVLEGTHDGEIKDLEPCLEQRCHFTPLETRISVGAPQTVHFSSCVRTTLKPSKILFFMPQLSSVKTAIESGNMRVVCQTHAIFDASFNSSVASSQSVLDFQNDLIPRIRRDIFRVAIRCAYLDVKKLKIILLL
jgi:hypothetical protein